MKAFQLIFFKISFTHDLVVVVVVVVVVIVVVVEDFGSWVSPPSLNCSLAPCPSTLTRLSVSGGVIPAKNPIYGCLGRPERTYSKVANGAIAIGS